MALKLEKKRIGRFEYEVKQLGAIAGRDLLVRLAKTLGPALGMVLNGKASLAHAGAALAVAAEHLDPAELEHFCDVLGRSSSVYVQEGGKSVVKTLDLGFQELHFAGEYAEMFEWLGFALEVNFGNFIAAVKARAASVQGESAETGQA
jgi:hypothetical protein